MKYSQLTAVTLHFASPFYRYRIVAFFSPCNKKCAKLTNVIKLNASSIIILMKNSPLSLPYCLFPSRTLSPLSLCTNVTLVRSPSD